MATEPCYHAAPYAHVSITSDETKYWQIEKMTTQHAESQTVSRRRLQTWTENMVVSSNKTIKMWMK